MTMIKVTVTIHQEQKEFLDKHPSFNISGILQEGIEDKKKSFELLDLLKRGLLEVPE